MSSHRKIFTCERCGKVIEVLHDGNDGLMCCGQNMNIFRDTIPDPVKDNGVMVMETADGAIKVKNFGSPYIASSAPIK